MTAKERSPKKILLEAVDLAGDPDLPNIMIEAAAAGVDFTAVLAEGLVEETEFKRAAAAKAAAEAEERANRPKPFWQLEDCGDYCIRTHSVGDGYDERYHGSGIRLVSLADGLATEGRPPYLAVQVRRFTGHSEPGICIQMQSGGELIWHTMTLENARQMSRNLAAMIEVARREISPEADH